MEPIQFCQLEIPVSDMKRALAFYGKVFGWRRVPFDIQDYVVIDVAEGQPFGVSLIPNAKTSTDASRGPTLYFRTDNLEDLMETWLQAGGTKKFGPKQLPGYGKVALVMDPDGNCWGLAQVRQPKS